MKRDTDQVTKQFSATPVELEDAFRRRAYEIYEKRGRADGFELDDWVQLKLKYWIPRKCEKQHELTLAERGRLGHCSVQPPLSRARAASR